MEKPMNNFVTAGHNKRHGETWETMFCKDRPRLKELVRARGTQLRVMLEASHITNN